MTRPEILILRHGETEWNVENRLQGRLDSPLTARGLAQAEAQADTLSSHDLGGFRFRSSPQMRAFRTAAIALAGIASRIETDPRLCEIDVGAWSGVRREDMKIDFVWHDTADGALEIYERAPEGEGFAALRARCEAFLDDLTGPTVIVTHGITSRMLRLVAMDLPTADLDTLPGGQGVIYRVANGVHSAV